jgi:hypothetical protein
MKAISYNALSSEALAALVELENYLHRGRRDLTSTKRLFAHLRSGTGLSVFSLESIKNASPTALAVYARALRRSSLFPVNRTEDLSKNVVEYAKLLNKHNLRLPEVAKLRDFCGALHRELLSEDSLHSTRPATYERRRREVTFGLR